MLPKAFVGSMLATPFTVMGACAASAALALLAAVEDFFAPDFCVVGAASVETVSERLAEVVMLASGIETRELSELFGTVEAVPSREALTRWPLVSVTRLMRAKVTAAARMKRRLTESSESELRGYMKSWPEYHRLHRRADAG